jgi:hypothetical protein
MEPSVDEQFNTNLAKKQRLDERLVAIHNRVQWMADEEARSAWVGGLAGQGHFLPEKERLIDETDKILDQLDKLTGDDNR